ncbi:branched-chain amino acid ABC transporter permease [Ancylobacter sp. SL191]|uniref:branched-chain amino acid ABC transporter permease n=1 Tax=Ancylobacter sp. SL191 TaxID=2995166 RepID=UPI00227025DE|nr:branched-chain amino acid ABC transporter permease [Ancylobacter sp. SL191]WAC25613.1 branched-chain amino acid ABC transporter permease [Ancylobacter sp. SL191]
MSGFILFLVSLLSLGAIYAILCLALNLESGVGGLWDLGIASFFGIGAYSYVLVTAGPAAAYQHYLLGLGLPIWIGILAAMAMACLCAALIGALTLKLKREYFLITTLAFSEVIRQVYANEDWLTNGVAGIYGLAQPLRGWVAPELYPYLLLALILAGLALVALLVTHLSQAPFGRTLRALRENEALAVTAGIDPRRFHLRAYVIAGMLSAVAGVFYVWYNTIVNSAQFGNDITFFVWTALIIGGIGRTRGALLGGFIFVLLHDLLRFVSVSGEMAATLSSLRTVAIGAVLILILRFRPNGLIPERPLTLAPSGMATVSPSSMVSRHV